MTEHHANKDIVFNGMVCSEKNKILWTTWNIGV